MARKLDERQGRGDFFKSLGTLLAGFMAEQVEEAVVGLSPAALRPPGALDELAFLTECTRCDRCIEACPHEALVRTSAVGGLGMGTPQVVPRNLPCFLCEELPCVKACPAGALRWPRREEGGLDGPRAVRMGLAVVDERRCLTWPRAEYPAMGCRTCVDRCPFPGEALALSQEEPGRIPHPVVDASACVGCGLCEFVCPANRPAIVVEPRR